MTTDQPNVILRGRLICINADQIDAVTRHLPNHIVLTRAEPGCLKFDVQLSAESGVWAVHEEFTDATAFESHQRRVAASEWGRATAGIERDYTVQGTTVAGLTDGR